MKSPDTDEHIDRVVFDVVTWIAGGTENLEILESTEKFHEVIQDQSWTIMTQICEKIQYIQISPDIIDRYGQVVDKFILESSKKEMVYVIMECCEAFKNPNLFCCLVPRLRDLLLGLPPQQVQIDICFGTLYSHVRASHSIPEDYIILEEDGKELNPSSTAVDNLLTSLNAVIDCIEPFVISSSKRNDQMNRDELETDLLKLLNYPLLYLPTDSEQILNICNRVVDLVVEFNPTLLCDYLIIPADSKAAYFNTDSIIQDPTRTALHEECDMHDSLYHGVAHLLYLVFCKNMQIDRVPCVYEADYRFRMVLPFLSSLYLRSTLNIIAQKSIQLTVIIIQNIPPTSLHQDITENQHFRGLIMFTFWSARLCNLTSVRRESVQLFKMVLSKLTRTARYNTLRWILTERAILGPEVTGFITTVVKDELNKVWDVFETDSQVYKQLKPILEIIYKVPKGEQADLIGDLDFVSAALNLARYLIMKMGDRVTKVTSTINELLNLYIYPIESVMLSYKDNLLAKIQELSLPGEKSEQPELTVDAGGESITLNKEVELEASKSALSKLELVLHVHSCLKKAVKDNQPI